MPVLKTPVRKPVAEKVTPRSLRVAFDPNLGLFQDIRKRRDRNGNSIGKGRRFELRKHRGEKVQYQALEDWGLRKGRPQRSYDLTSQPAKKSIYYS